jgi:hypothetical protein
MQTTSALELLYALPRTFTFSLPFPNRATTSRLYSSLFYFFIFYFFFEDVNDDDDEREGTFFYMKIKSSSPSRSVSYQITFVAFIVLFIKLIVLLLTAVNAEATDHDVVYEIYNKFCSVTSWCLKFLLINYVQISLSAYQQH